MDHLLLLFLPPLIGHFSSINALVTLSIRFPGVKRETFSFYINVAKWKVKIQRKWKGSTKGRFMADVTK